MAKALYQELFDWLIDYINESIRQYALTDTKSSIGILDIFGFENFQVNKKTFKEYVNIYLICT